MKVKISMSKQAGEHNEVHKMDKGMEFDLRSYCLDRGSVKQNEIYD